VGGGNGVSFAPVQIQTPGTSISIGDCTFDGWTHGVYAWGSTGTFDKIVVHDCKILNCGATYPLENGFSGSAAWGSSVRAHDNLGFHDCVDLLNNVLRARGSGAPAIAAGVGSTYQRSDGGAGTSFYVKESGTGTTGWVGK
jgi:hypothetical protein